MSSLDYTHQLETDASSEAIWALYEDVSSWPEWDGLERMTDGPFAAGTSGTMKPVGQAPLGYHLTMDPLREFVDETPVGEIVVRVSHRLTPIQAGRLRLTYAVEIDGSVQHATEIGAIVTADFPATMASLVALAKGSA